MWVDRTKIKPGQRWELAIRTAVRSGDFFLACFSKTSVEKIRSGMNQELVLAVNELMLRPLDRTWFIPVLFSECEIPEYNIGGAASLRSIQYINLQKGWNIGVERILDVVIPQRSAEIKAHNRYSTILKNFGVNRSKGETYIWNC